MFRMMALASLVLFAFMAGVIFGAKNNKTSAKIHVASIDDIPLSDLDVSKKIAPIKKTLKLATTKKTPSTRSGYTLVLSSFKSMDSATAHAKSISRKGFNAFTYTTSISGKTWHRVGLGSFSSRKEAQDLKKQLKDQRFAKGSLISKLPSKIE